MKAQHRYHEEITPGSADTKAILPTHNQDQDQDHEKEKEEKNKEQKEERDRIANWKVTGGRFRTAKEQTGTQAL